MSMKYVVKSKDGNYIVGEYGSRKQAEAVIDEQEEFDIEDGCYEEGFYYIEEVNGERGK